jgi:hypothetical protein
LIFMISFLARGEGFAWFPARCLLNSRLFAVIQTSMLFWRGPKGDRGADPGVALPHRCDPAVRGRNNDGGDDPWGRFVALNGRNHLMLVSEPISSRFPEEIRSFLASADPGEGTAGG